MKLISNYKDYYDYLIGKYGIDDKCVYERICSTENDERKWVKTGIHKPDCVAFPERYSFYMLAVCGTIYCCYYYGGKFYYGQEAEGSIPPKIQRGKYDYVTHTTEDVAKAKFHGTKTTLNEELRCPVILVSRTWEGDGWHADVLNPKLDDFQFGKVLSAEECFIQISSFLLREKPVVDNRTNKEKIQSAGFDTKTSFRNM